MRYTYGNVVPSAEFSFNLLVDTFSSLLNTFP